MEDSLRQLLLQTFPTLADPLESADIAKDRIADAIRVIQTLSQFFKESRDENDHEMRAKVTDALIEVGIIKDTLESRKIAKVEERQAS